MPRPRAPSRPCSDANRALCSISVDGDDAADATSQAASGPSGSGSSGLPVQLEEAIAGGSGRIVPAEQAAPWLAWLQAYRARWESEVAMPARPPPHPPGAEVLHRAPDTIP